MALRLKGNTPLPGEPDKRYYMIDVQEGGRRERISSGTRNKDLATRREQAVLDALRADLAAPREALLALARGEARAARMTSSRTLKEACDDALNDDKGWGGSTRGWANANSRSTYATNCRMLQRKLGANRSVVGIDQAALDKLVLDLQGDGGSPTTVNRKVFCLMAVLRREKYHKRYPADLPDYRNSEEASKARQFVLTRQEEEELFAEVLLHDSLPDGNEGGCPRKRDAHEYHDLFVFLADVGCRLNQALKVRWRDIVDDDQFVRFWRKAEQKGGKNRTTPLSSRVREALGRRRSAKTLGPFTGLNKRRSQHLWSSAKARTSLAAEKEAIIHCLRHTCATRLLEATGDLKLVQEWLGHTKIETTANIYTKVLTGHKTAALALFEGRWNNSAGIPATQPFRDSNSPETGIHPITSH